MIPNMGGLNSKRLKSMMKQMGISNEEISANKVIIQTDDGNIIIENPKVTKVSMQGQETFQILGDIKREEKKQEIDQEDIDLVAQKANVSSKKAKELLEKAKGDIAKAISSIEE